MPKKSTRKSTTGSKKTVETLKHAEAKRSNIPTAELHTVMEDKETYSIQVAIARRNPDLDPQLVWRGKDTKNWSDLVVNTPPLYIQEKVHPKVLIDELLRQTEADKEAADKASGVRFQLDLFADFNGIPKGADKTEFYPPYDIKFNSNFQWSMTSRDVKDGKPTTSRASPSRSKPSETPGATASTAT